MSERFFPLFEIEGGIALYDSPTSTPMKITISDDARYGAIEWEHEGKVWRFHVGGTPGECFLTIRERSENDR